MTIQNKTEIKNRNNRMERFVKRSTDILVSVPCLVLSSPLFVIISLAIKWEDGLPIIYKQERIGLHGKPFNIYKFRSMKADAEKDGPNLLEIEGDTRLTRVGKFIRTHHLDELPQLWNILKETCRWSVPRPNGNTTSTKSSSMTLDILICIRSDRVLLLMPPCITDIRIQCRRC